MRRHERMSRLNRCLWRAEHIVGTGWVSLFLDKTLFHSCAVICCKCSHGFDGSV